MAVWARDVWLLTAASALTAGAAIVVPWVYPPATTYGWALKLVIGLGCLAAISVGLDRLADQYEKKESDLLGEAEQEAASTALTALLELLESAHAISFLEGAARQSHLVTLQTQLADYAAKAPTALRVRASFYPLTIDEDGWRELRNPTSRGRVDKASTEFLEKEDPSHPIWALMSGRDSDCSILEDPDSSVRIAWDDKPYKAVISVPVAATDVVFGMLSVNAPHVGDLTEQDRLTVIAMARVMAGLLAEDEGPRNLRDKKTRSATMGPQSKGAEDA